jgi:hypothetical protein
MNNPLVYVDENGEFIWTIFNFFKDLFVNTFTKSWSQGFNAWSSSDNWHNTAMAWEIDKGLFYGNPLQILSRFTWELPQTVMGYAVNGAYATEGGVKSVTHWGGATAVETYASNWGGFTLSSFIMGERGLQADPNNSLFQHEYGHYLQSQVMGWGYLSRVGIPSLMSTIFYDDNNHDFQPYEQDANPRAFMYFNKNVEGFYKTFDERFENRGWDFYNNPLDVYHVGKGSRGDYYDYRNSEHQALVNSLSLRTKWYDYLDPFGLIVGTGNGIYYNKHRIR